MNEWEATADLVVVGTGVAGLTAALEATSLGLRVVVVTKAQPEDGNTRWAQGGIAVALPEFDGDSVERHVADTLIAGAGLCEEATTRTILRAAPAAVARLLRRGASFDMDWDGQLARTREGGHSRFRVIHAGGDATGAEVERALLAAADRGRVCVLPRHCVADILLSASGRVAGVLVLDPEGRFHVARAPAVLLATGGVGELYSVTTNAQVATADGLALALRAGAAVADVEFVQFHPTALYTGFRREGRRPLISESVRGEGGVLIDHAGLPVMTGVHPLADLAPRDVVATAIANRMATTGSDCVYLDATRKGREFQRRFPTVYAACAAADIDPATEPIPVAPAAHYHCGGVLTDVDGHTTVPGLYAAGEVARTGLHGANRLASNGLLEGLVVGCRAVRAIKAEPLGTVTPVAATIPTVSVADRRVVQRAMTRYAGMRRDATGMATAVGALAAAAAPRPLQTRADMENAALTLAAHAVLVAAMTRSESRGCHVRTDHPERGPEWQRSIVVALDDTGLPVPVSVAVGGRA